MVSTPAQLLQTSLLFYRITKQHGSGWGLGGGLGGGHDKHMRSAAADQPARFPEGWGGHGKHTASSQQTHLWGVGWGGG